MKRHLKEIRSLLQLQKTVLYVLIYCVLSLYNIACAHYTNKVNSTA